MCTVITGVLRESVDYNARCECHALWVLTPSAQAKFKKVESLASVWDPVRSSAAEMLIAANDMVSGLQAPDTGQIRQAALDGFATAVTDLTQATAAAKAAAGG